MPTHEGRRLVAARLSETGGDTGRPQVVIDGLIHPGELTGGTSAHFVFAYLAQSQDQRVVDLLQRVDIYLIPIVNPDGYAQVPPTRKNRRPNPDGSFGVNLNRNFPAAWNTLPSSDSDPAGPQYHGPFAGSEPETFTWQQFVLDLGRVFIGKRSSVSSSKVCLLLLQNRTYWRWNSSSM